MATTAPVGLDQAFDTAFDAAVDQHKAADSSPAPEASAPDASEAETPSQQQPEPEEKAPPQATESADEPQLLTPEQSNLTGRAREKALNAAWTQKTQQLAEQRKQLAEAQRIYEAIQQDPQGTIAQLAQELGLTVAAEQNGAQATQAAVQDKANEIAAELELEFGPDVAQKLAGTIERIAQKVAQKAVEPFQQRDQQRERQAQIEEGNTALQQLQTKYPDAVKFDAKMAELAARVQVVPGRMTPYEYLETLYHLASRDQTEAEQTRKVLDRMAKSAKTAENPAPGVTNQIVQPAPPPEYGESLDKALDASWAAAKRGIRW